MAGRAQPVSDGAGSELGGGRVYTVGEITAEVKETLEVGFSAVRVRGEISGFKLHAASGHAYFSLKDDRALLACVAWASSVRRLPRPLLEKLRREPEGLAVVASGRIGVYEPRGQYQLYVERLEEEGRGDLHAAFLRLRARLEAEGLFAPERKRPLPAFPRRIGLVTSAGGAALRDMLRILARRWPAAEVVLRPAAVQGAGAAEEIAAALAELNALGGVEVIIAGRGGGSLEDLWAWNEETTARAIAASRVPVISAVGHETDFTIADFVADARAATPTHAAQIAVPDRAELIRQVAREGRILRSVIAGRLETSRLRVVRLRDSRGLRRPEDLVRRRMLDLDRCAERLRGALAFRRQQARDRLAMLERRLLRLEPRERLALRRARLQDLRGRWAQAAARRVEGIRRRLELAEARLGALGPEGVLARGYGLVLREADGAILRSSEQVLPGDRVRVRLHRGALRCQVEVSIPPGAAGPR